MDSPSGSSTPRGSEGGVATVALARQKERAQPEGWTLKQMPWRWHIFRRGSPPEYRLRWCLSLPCSGWERVGRHRSNHQDSAIIG